jgi:ribosomal protein L21E
MYHWLKSITEMMLTTKPTRWAIGGLNRNEQEASPSMNTLMRRFEVGDCVRVDIPDRDDPDFDRYHGRTGEVVEVIEDEAGQATGDERDSHLFEVAFENGEYDHFRWRDLRPGDEKVS